MSSRLLKLSFIMGFFIALLLAFTSVAAAAPLQISTSSREGRPDVHGNMVVWKRIVNGNYNIVSCDLPSCKPQNIADGYPTYENVPATNGTIIVWHDSRNGKADIYAKDPLFPPYPIASGPGFQILPAISGNKVVYVDNQVSTSPADVDADNNIYMVDLSKPNEPVSVCDAPGSQWQPHISGTKVVWQDYRNGRWDVYEKDIDENGNGRRLTVKSSGDNIAPDISGDRVVWRNKDGALEEIRWMSLTDEDGTFHIVTDAAVSPNSPRVSGDLVVWMDHRNDQDPNKNYDIYMKDLTSGEPDTLLAGGNAWQAFPAVDRETVVWEENESSIWMAAVPDVTPPAISSLTPADGLHTGCVSPGISASYTDNRIGVDAGSVRLTVDGEDVTAAATVTGSSVSYQPDSLAEGQHSATVTVADQSGNSRSASWQFYTSRPSMHLNVQPAFWASYGDHENHELSVPYQLLNATTDTPAFSVKILASPATPGVILASPVPAAVGDIAPGSYSGVVLKYLIPSGVTSFRTSLYAGGADACGATWYFPGPPPGG